VKLSVKWLAGLAVLVLAVMAVVGSTSATKAATGSVFVVNEWSTITNESPAPTGRVSRTTVFATIDDGVRLIETNADFIRVVVKDADLDTLVTSGVVTAAIDVISGGDGAHNVTTGIGNSAVIQLTGKAGTLIAGDLASVQANTSILVGGSNELNAGNGGSELTISGYYAGDGSNDPWIAVTVNIAGPYALSDVIYQTSTADTVIVTVKSELEPDGITITASETGLSTGVFEGFVQLVPSTATSTNGSTGTAIGTAGTIRTTVGPLTVSFDDAGTQRQTTVSVDTSAPTNSASAPVSGTATQSLRPTFSGTVAEVGAGLDVSSIQAVYDNRDDAANATIVITISAPNVSFPGTAGTDYVVIPISTTSIADGDTAFTFSQTPSADVPSTVATTPRDHIVDWVIRASDLAGNIGVSDSDSTTAGVQLHTVKVDKKLPAFSATAAEHKTGLATSGTGEVSSRNSVRVVFDDQVTNVENSDFKVTLDSGAIVVPVSVTVVNSPTTPAGFANRGLVYLTFENDLVSSDTPVVALQAVISDLAGNFTQTGSTVVADGIAPSLTVTLSGGSGTGTGSEGPTGLTKDTMLISITSDETLSGAPSVAVHIDDASSSELTPTALAQGANAWIATYSKPGSPADGQRAIVVTGTDTAANSATVGTIDADLSTTPDFVLDTALAVPTLAVGGGASTTDQTRPSITIDYKAASEASTVTLTKVQLDGVDITANVVPSSDGKRFFYVPPTDLTLGDHILLIEAGDAADAAVNKNTSNTSLTVTIKVRSTFDLDVFSGWNAISFPSDPIDPDMNTVFGNVGHDAVLGFKAGVPGGWMIAVRDSVSGLLEPASEYGMNSVRSTQAYWVHSLNFEPIKVLLIGETLPAAGSPPSIVTIPTVLGFNAIPIIDTSRKLTTGASGVALVRQIPGGSTSAVTVATYLGAVTEGRVYRWNPEILTYVLLSGSTAVNTGEVLFVEVTGTAVPIFP